MSSVDTADRRHRLGVDLPPPDERESLFTTAVLTGSLAVTSGFGPYWDGRHIFIGKVGSELTIEQGQDAAWISALNCLGALRDLLGSLDAIERIVRLTGWVNAGPEFTKQPAVIDGASSLLLEVLGERGQHTRAALGMASLPFNIPVELEVIAEVRNQS